MSSQDTQKAPSQRDLWENGHDPAPKQGPTKSIPEKILDGFLSIPGQFAIAVNSIATNELTQKNLKAVPVIVRACVAPGVTINVAPLVPTLISKTIANAIAGPTIEGMAKSALVAAGLTASTDIVAQIIQNDGEIDLVPTVKKAGVAAVVGYFAGGLKSGIAQSFLNDDGASAVIGFLGAQIITTATTAPLKNVLTDMLLEKK